MAQDDEYPAGVSDGRLAACQQDVLKMVELAAQVAEGLAANVDPEAEGAPEANTIKEDAAMFLRLADGVQETMAQSRWPVEHAYARSAENLLLRRRLDEMVEEAQDELGHALRTHLAAALRDQAANAARPPEAGAEDEEAQLCRAMDLVRKCEETAEAAGVRVPQATTAAAPPPAVAAAPAPPAPAPRGRAAARAAARAATRAGGADGRRRAGAGAACSAAMDGAGDQQDDGPAAESGSEGARAGHGRAQSGAEEAPHRRDEPGHARR